MTEKLYYQDAYQKEFTATVEKVRLGGGKVEVLLDQTAFYPEGGGQGADHGVFQIPGGLLLQVTDVQEEEGEIWHTVEPCCIGSSDGASSGDTLSGSWNVMDAAARQKSVFTDGLLKEGMEIKGRIDWEHRFDHMQQHSGEHIVSGMICKKFHCDNVGFHLGEDVVTIDFNVRITMEQAEEIERAANQYIWDDHPLEILWPSEEELEQLEYRSKKELEGEVRIARFPDADCCACCGTHVAWSSEIGLVKFISAKNFHEGTRLELLCGKRAMEFLSMNFKVNKAAAVLLSTSEENTASFVKKLQEDLIQQKAETASMEEKLFRYWAETFRGQKNVLVIDGDLTGVQARSLADRIADICSGFAAVFAGEEGKYQYAVIQKNADISAMIREMNAALHGRGGGRNGFAQGSVEASRQEIRQWFEKNTCENGQ